MYTIHTLHNKKRRGITTILGTLIFISILFTTLLPMQITMLQTDTYESQLIQELDITNSEKKQEKVSLVAYPTSTTGNSLKVRIQNTGTIDIKIVKLWIKNQMFLVDETIDRGQIRIVGSYNVELLPNTFYPVKAVTERGNLFGSNAGNMIYTSNGIWFTPSLGINVYIANDKGKYWVQVSNSTWYSDPYITSGQDFGDLVIWFDVDTIDTYHVVCKKNSADGPNLPGTPTDVSIIWPEGPPILFVYTSGLDT